MEGIFNMSKIYIKKDFYKFPDVQYCYSYNSEEYNNTICYRLDSLEYSNNVNFNCTSMLTSHEPPLPTLDSDSFQYEIYQKVNKLLFQAVKSNDFKDEYIIEIEE